MSSSFSRHVSEASGSVCTLRGLTASRRPQTAMNSEGPGRLASVRQWRKPTSSTNRSAAPGDVTARDGSRRQ